MAWPFVVIGEFVAVVADLDNRLVEFKKTQRRRLRGNDIDLALAKHRMQRILRKNMFDVGDEQFLMLLLVMNPENEDWFDFIEKFVVRVPKEIFDVRIDRSTISTRVFDGGPRDQTAQVAPVHVAGGIVVGVKQISVLRNFSPIIWNPFLENKRFEKPGGVRQMPFRRAHIRHRLHNAIFGLESRAKRVAETSNFAKARKQTIRS